MAQKKRAARWHGRAYSAQRAWSRVPAVRRPDLRLPAVLARADLRRALSADVAGRVAARRLDPGSAPPARRRATLRRRNASRTHPTPPSRRTRKHWPRRAGARKRSPMRRAKRRRRRPKLAARKWTRSSMPRSPKRRRPLPPPGSAAMANVHAIASETAPAIVERLTGIAPASEEVAEAVSYVLKH